MSGAWGGRSTIPMNPCNELAINDARYTQLRPERHCDCCDKKIETIEYPDGAWQQQFERWKTSSFIELCLSCSAKLNAEDKCPLCNHAMDLHFSDNMRCCGRQVLFTSVSPCECNLLIKLDRIRLRRLAADG